MRIRGLFLRVAVAICGGVVALAASADIVLPVGISGYAVEGAPDWTCPAVARVLERKLSERLDEPVRIELHLYPDYGDGADAYASGAIQVGHVPSLGALWAMRPEIEARVLDAWRDGLASMRRSELRAAALEGPAGDSNCRRLLRPVRSAERTPFVTETPQFLYVAGLPRYEMLAELQGRMAIEFLNSLPATASGPPPAPSAPSRTGW